MSSLLDSSVVIDVLRQHGPALEFLEGLEEVPFCSEVIRVEITRGLRSGERSGVEQLLSSLSWVDVDEAVARRAGELGRFYRRSHTGLSSADLIIGATAQELGITVATRNVRHFPMFKGLRPPYL